jgi:polyketide synthase 12
MFTDLTELFATGVLRPPPVQAWPLGRARQALRHMGQARHTGKLVLDVPAVLNPEGTVLITGGTGTLGGLVAEHLVRTWHVRHLLLVSRRGPEAPGAETLATRLGELGADVDIAALDTTDRAALDAAIAGIDPHHPLTGVVHAAGVVEDAVVTAQTSEGLARVWSAKAASAANLHEATAGLRLGLFAIFSSAAATMGSPGQANYAAANAFCDALAAYRRRTGRPGLSVGWGLWAASGGMSGDLGDADRARMSRLGMHAMSAEQGLALLDAAYRHGDPHLVAAALDTTALTAQPAEALPPPLRALAGGTGGRPAAANDQRPVDWTSKLTGLPAAEQQSTLLTLVRTHAATVLGHPDPDAVPADAAFKELGFDSLTAVELRNRLGAATGLRLPAALVFRHPTPASIAGHLRERLCPADAAAEPVFGELALLETAMAEFTPDDEARGKLAKRLETLLWRLNYGAADADEETLDEASDDEMFELIDRELGSS